MGDPVQNLQVLERSLSLLTELASSEEPLSAPELARRAELPVSTTYRLASALEQAELIFRERRGALRLGYGFLEYARAIEESVTSSLVIPAQEPMRQLALRCEETVLLTVPSGSHAIGLANAESPRPVRLTFALWRRAPLELGASGKILLAFAEDYVRLRGLSAAAKRGGARFDRAALEGDLEKIRRDGYAHTSGELDEGAVAYAVPVRNNEGRLLAGLTVAGPSARMETLAEDVVPWLRDSAVQIAGLTAQRAG